jgi:fatty acid synthase subunit beta, fungi type
MNAGYQIELAGGGYFAPHMMEAVVREIVANTNPGVGVCINAIYINPRLFNWQMDLVKSLRASGVGVEGVTIGAGVPSLEVAADLYFPESTELISSITSFQKLGVKYLALKPGSNESLGQVVAIARAHPTFPIICQWTGGRAGGHHSFEDFHSPILSMYSTVRRCSNIILIAGSGFGGADDTEPYLTGEWALKFAHPPMPFDGVLFGSRVMTALEARTSLAVCILLGTN